MKPAKDIWELVQTELVNDMTPVAFTTWFSDTEPLSASANQLVLFIPDETRKNVIETRYQPLILAALRRILRTERIELRLICDPGERDTFLREQEQGSGIAARYTFETFIIGNSNRFAQAAAMAVATRPASSYNPLFIYGPSGLGKTHLLYAIANMIKKDNPEFSIVYIRGDEFTNELITSIQSGTVEPFRQKYRRADLFLVDDIQFVAGKERTQEEFFHTFNSLHESGKQIVLTSDRPPREMHTLEDRLRTRFEWGLLADIQPPDYETRMAIISTKAKTLNLPMPGDVLDYLATSIKNNIRQLEGAVKKLSALHELMHADISLRLAEQVVQDIINEGNLPTASAILSEVASIYNVPLAKLTGNNRSKELVVPRQIAMYLVRNLTPLSLPDIGREFNRDHSTVLHAVNKVEVQMVEDPVFSGRIKDLIKNIQNK